MKARSLSNVFKVLGMLFFIIGSLSLLGVIAHWHFERTIPWLFVAYTAMNFLLAVGFWNRERWLLIAVGLNCAGYTLLYIGAWLMGSSVDLATILVSTVVAGSIWGVVYLHRGRLTGSSASFASIGFILIWLAAYSYTFAQVF